MTGTQGVNGRRKGRQLPVWLSEVQYARLCELAGRQSLAHTIREMIDRQHAEFVCTRVARSEKRVKV